VTTRGCIFDGRRGPRPKLSNAHVIRKGWIKELYPDLRFRHLQVEHDPHPDVEPFETWWSKKEADFKVRRVCQGCNEGWMETLDRDAERIFANDAARGRPAKVESMADRKTLARWCSLVTLLWDQKQKPPRLGSYVHAAVFNGDVPEGAGIWVAATEPPTLEQPLVYAHPRDAHNPDLRPKVEAAREEGRFDLSLVEGLLLTFGVGRLLAQTYIPVKDGGEFVPDRRLGNWSLLRQLWPDTLMPLVWPPPIALPRDEVEAFAHSFKYWTPRPAS
jgi:hypothetical protein